MYFEDSTDLTNRRLAMQQSNMGTQGLGGIRQVTGDGQVRRKGGIQR